MMPIDHGMLKFYEELKAKSPPESVNWPLPKQRQAWDEVCRAFRAPRPDGIETENRLVDGVPVRIFRPRGEKAKPGVIYFHGGGWVLGSCETHDDMCAEMAAGADSVVVLVDYRLAPEHPHPAQFEDSHKVLSWMRGSGGENGIDETRTIAAGDSAGGQMTVGLALSLRDRGIPQLRGQVLISIHFWATARTIAGGILMPSRYSLMTSPVCHRPSSRLRRMTPFTTTESCLRRSSRRRRLRSPCGASRSLPIPICAPVM
jgi:acetyl esterase/lipase